MTSCSNLNTEKSDVELKVQTVLGKFTLCQELALFHSRGLEYSIEKFSQDASYREATKDQKIAMITLATSDFSSQEAVFSTLRSFEAKISLNMPENVLRSANNDSTDVALINILTYFDSVVDKIIDASLVHSAILSTIKSEEFLAFPEAKQNVLLLMFAIYENSSQFWSDNSNILASVPGVLKAGVIDDYESETDDDANRRIWKADAVGGLAGLIGGGIAGAITGSFAGGAGAISGGMTGAVGGAIGGAISGSLTAWLLPNDVVVSQDANNADSDTITSLEIYNNLLNL